MKLFLFVLNFVNTYFSNTSLIEIMTGDRIVMIKQLIIEIKTYLEFFSDKKSA